LPAAAAVISVPAALAGWMVWPVEASSGHSKLYRRRAINDPTARNVAQAIIRGVVRDTETRRVRMPAFGKAYSDIEIAEIANYVVSRFCAEPPSIIADQVAKLRGEASQ
jgi:hypothetical protein